MLTITYRHPNPYSGRHELIETPAELRPGSRSGTWNVWPIGGGNALATRIPADRAARSWPEHADAILSRPDSTD